LQQKNTRSGLVFLIIAVKLNSETVIAVKMPLTVVRMAVGLPRAPWWRRPI